MRLEKVQLPMATPSVLEIGRGEGATAVFLASKGYEVTAFDFSSVAICKARHQYEEQSLEIDLFQADLNEFLLEKNFDIHFLIRCFEIPKTWRA